MTIQISLSTINPMAPPDFSGYLSPDALMTYCRTRLQGIDSQVQEAFAKQQAANQTSSALGSLANSITLPSASLDLTNEGDFKTALHTAQQIKAAADAATDPQTKKELQAAADKIFGKLTKVVKDKENNPDTFANVDETTTDASLDDVFSNKDGLYGGSVSDDDKTYSIDSFKGDTADTIHSIQQDLNSSSELSMINLQSLMSQRQEAIQLATNLVQSLGDQANKIAENVGK